MEKKKLRQKKLVNEDLRMVRNMFILLILVGLCIVGLYFLTNKLLKKDDVKKEETTKSVKIDYNIATIGTMFNRSESEYYVFLYSNKDDGKTYDTVVTSYRSSENYVKTYYIDLDVKFNSKVLGDELVKKPTNSEEVKVKGATLYKIKNGKVTNCYTDKDKIIDILK